MSLVRLGAYIKDWFQYISIIDSVCSSLLPATSGVPQGSTPGRLLFLLLSMIFPLVPNPSPYFFLLMIASVLAQSNPHLTRHYFRRTWIILCSGYMNGFFHSTSPSVINLLGSLTHFPSHQANLPHWQLQHFTVFTTTWPWSYLLWQSLLVTAL